MPWGSGSIGGSAVALAAMTVALCLSPCDLQSIGGSAVPLVICRLQSIGGSAIALAAIDALGRWLSFSCLCHCCIDALGRWLSFACLCHCDLQSIGGSAVTALAAIDALGWWLSFACLYHCDLKSVGGSGGALAAIDALGRWLSIIGGSAVALAAIIQEYLMFHITPAHITCSTPHT